MTIWTEGYVSGIDYTNGYYKELNPNRAKLAFLSAGVKFPSIKNACELGFGQGVSINFHAAATSVNWYGNDFNPSQVGFARDLSQNARGKLSITDHSFEQYSGRTDLPEFDFIGLHGIWSWVSNKNQNFIIDFISRNLKVGGVLYIGYNTLPGWASFVPVQHLMNVYTDVMSDKSEEVVSRIDNSLKFVQNVFDKKPIFSKSNPNVVDRFEGIKRQNIRYLAHEYYNKDWQPDNFSNIASMLHSAKLDYVCSANYLEHIDEINFTQDQRDLISGISDQILRESTRDFILNRQFRKDYWVKGKRSLGKIDQLETMRNIKLFLTRSREDIPLVLNTYVGEVTLYANVYNPLLDLLKNHQPRRIGEIEDTLLSKGIVFSQIMEAITVLIGIDAIDFAQDDQSIEDTLNSCKELNDHLIKRSVSDGELPYLVSPVSGGGFPVDRFGQLFLLARSNGLQTADEYAQFALDLLKSQGQNIFKEGVELKSDEEMLAEVRGHAKAFEIKHLPVLKTMGIA